MILENVRISGLGPRVLGRISALLCRLPGPGGVLQVGPLNKLQLEAGR